MPTLTRRGGELAFVVALVAVCASIVSFVVLLESNSPGWGVVALNLATGCVALGFAVYAVVLQPDAKAFVWYLVAGAAAALAGSAAARMERR
jgi:uncharacterized membrane protein